MKISKEDLERIFPFVRYGEPFPDCYVEIIPLPERSKDFKVFFGDLHARDGNGQEVEIPGFWTFGKTFRVSSEEELFFNAELSGRIPLEVKEVKMT